MIDDIGMVFSKLTIFGAFIVGLWNLWKGVDEWVLQGRQKRADMFMKKQAEFYANPVFNKIRYFIEIEFSSPKNTEKIQNLNIEEKRAYLTFFEEIALLKNSKLINPALATYMFGYYAVSCHACETFWEDMDRNNAFWGVFNTFVMQCQPQVNNLEPIADRYALF